MDERRCRLLVQRAIETFGLDLRGRVVLTEAGTNVYLLTPFIAALAGADRVLALTRDSRHGAADDIEERARGLAHRWGVDGRVEVLRSRTDPRLAEADIVTNLGFVRPLDSALLRQLKPSAVISLMWETWEFRSDDLDLPECRRLGIPVLGTDEHHPDLQTFGYIGHLAMKLLLSLEIEVFRSRVVVLGSGEFAERTAVTLTAAGAEVALLTPEELRRGVRQKTLCDADALIVVEHHDRRALIGAGADVTAEDLLALNPHLAIAHICGGVDRPDLEAAGFQLLPGRFAPPGYMSVALDHVGPRPVVDLHAAGLRVGQQLAAARAAGLSATEAESAVLAALALAQGFGPER